MFDLKFIRCPTNTYWDGSTCGKFYKIFKILILSE